MSSPEDRTGRLIGFVRGLSRRALAVLVGGLVVVGIGLGLAAHAVAGLVGPDAPANATPGTAVEIKPGATTFSGTTVGASPYVDSDSGVVDTSGDAVWFAWTPDLGGQVLLLPNGMGATLPSVGVFTGQVGGLAAVDLTQVKGKTSFTATAGTRYLFEVATRSGHDLDFQYTLWATTTSAGPVNDAFASAVSLNPAVDHASRAMRSVAGTLAAATTEDDEPHPGSGATVWYTWTAPNAGASLDLTVDGTRVLRTYTLAAPDPVSEASGAAQPTVSVISRLAAAGGSGTSITLGGADSSEGQTFYLQVAGDAATAGFTLTGTEAGYRAPDLVAPVVDCAAPSTAYAQAPTIACTATDGGSGIAPADGLTVGADGIGRFTLAVDVPEGSTTTKGRSQSRTVCDVADNCVTAGPVAGIKVDDAAPRVTCEPVPATWQTTPTVSVACSATDGDGSGLDSADESFTLVATGMAGEASRTVPFAPYGAATAEAPLGEICDHARNCAPIVMTGGAGEAGPSGEAPTEPSSSGSATVTAMIDLAPPSVSCDTSDLSDGWSSTNATVTCTAGDEGSGLADQAQSSFTLTTSVAEATTDARAAFGSQSVCDVAGTCVVAAVTRTVRIDRTVPVVSCSVPAPGTWEPGQTLSVPCTATDDADGSGLAEPEQGSFTLSGSIPAGTQSASIPIAAVEVCDAAGNCASTPSVDGVGLDDQAPKVDCGTTPSAWTDQAGVSVSCTADDADGSGLASASDAGFDLSSAPVADGGVDGQAPFTPRSDICDKAGNCAVSPTPVPAKVDRITPVLSCAVPVTPDTGYFVGEVRVTCTARDADSGLLDPAHATFTLVTSVGKGHDDDHARASTRLVYDVAGNVITAGADLPSFPVHRSVAGGIAAPVFADVPGQVTVLAGVTSDVTSIAVPVTFPAATSDLQVAVGCTPGTGDTFPMGETTVSCTARDTADQTSDADFAVRVSAAPQYALSGPLSRSDPLPVAGGGFSGPVSVELDGTTIRTLTPARGIVGGTVDLPDGTLAGSHLVVLRGVGADANPRLIVTPLVVTGDPVAPPTLEPEPEPTDEPSGEPSGQPSGQPSGEPSSEPSGQPSGKPGSPTSPSAPSTGHAHPGKGTPSATASATSTPTSTSTIMPTSPSAGGSSGPVVPGSTSAPTTTVSPGPEPSSAPGTAEHAAGGDQRDPVPGAHARSGLWIGAGVLALLLSGGGILLWRRRKT